MTQRLELRGDTWVLRVNGTVIETDQTDWQLVLRLVGADADVVARISIEAAPRIGDLSHLVESTLSSAAERINRQTLREARVSNNGALIIDFVGGDRCVVPPAEEIEAWNFVAASGERLTCTPGGKVVAWSR